MSDGDDAAPPAASPGPPEEEGSYTNRPSKWVPEEGGRTRHEEDERKERQGDTKVSGSPPPVVEGDP